MTVPENNPVVQQRRLRSELRRARDQAKFTQAQVAEAMDWSISKVIRMETGAVGVSTTDLRALLQLYGVDDRVAIDELVEVGKASRRRAWWDQLRGFLSDLVIKYIALESSASLVRQYQALVVPGLLQTREYTRAVLGVYGGDPDVIDRKIEVRLRRQRIIDQDSAAKFFFVIDEGVIRRWVGGREVMLAQLERLKALNRQPNISIQVVTFKQGENPGMKGSFIVFEFPADEQDHVVVLEPADQDLVILDDANQASRYVETFIELEGLAVPAADLDTVIDRVMQDMA